MLNSSPLTNIEDILSQIWCELLREKFSSDDSSWTEYQLVVGTSWTIYYASQNDKKTLLWNKSTSELWIWKPLKVSSLWYFIWDEWIIWMNLDTWEISIRLVFQDIGVWSVSKINVIYNMAFWPNGVCNFRTDRELTRRIMGDSLANTLHGDIEQNIQWKYTSTELWIWEFEQVFSSTHGTLILGKQWMAICGKNGDVLCKKEYSELGIQKTVRIYENWWIVGQNEKVQLDFMSGAVLAPTTPINIEEFLEFQEKNSHSLMKPLDWVEIPQKSQEVAIVQEATAWLAIAKL